MINLTIAICTIRDPKLYLIPTLNEIANCYKNGLTFEILVYGPKFTHVEHETKPIYFTENFPHGNIYGYNLLAANANGEFIAFLTDDMIVPENLFEIVDFMFVKSLSSDWRDRLGVFGFSMGGKDYSPFPNRLILPNFGFTPESVDKIVDRAITRGQSLRIPLVRFIAVNRTSMDQLMSSYLFHPAFRNGGGDQWLSIWAWYEGYNISENLPAVLIPRGNSQSVLTNLESDGETLRDLVDKLAMGYENYV